MGEAAAWTASVVVVENDVDDEREEAYKPPWRDRNTDPDTTDPTELPQLTRRVAALVEAMVTCWASRADWFIVVDDDTFVRPGILTEVLVNEDTGDLRMMGIPISSDAFALPVHQSLHGP